MLHSEGLDTKDGGGKVNVRIAKHIRVSSLEYKFHMFMFNKL